MRLALKYTIFKALEDRRPSVKFYEMRERHGTFRLRKCRFQFGELGAFLTRRALAYIDDFADLNIAEPPQQDLS